MPVLYHSVERSTDPGNPAAPKKNFASAKARGHMTLKEYAKYLAQQCGVGEGVVYNIFMQSKVTIPTLLGQGFIVDIGVGTYFLTLDAEGMLTPAEVINSTIRGNRLKFNPSKDFENGLNDIEYEKISE